MTKSARIQEGVVEFLADGCPHTVQEIKSFLQQVGISDYSEGQFSGSGSLPLSFSHMGMFR